MATTLGGRERGRLRARRAGLVAASILAFSLLAQPSLGTHGCDEEIVAAGPVYFIAGHLIGDKPLFSLWIYVESNGVAGLQRGGATLFGDLDVCQAFPTGHDTGVF